MPPAGAPASGPHGPSTTITSEAGTDPVSFQWMGPATLVVNLVTGTIASLLFHPLRATADSGTGDSSAGRPDTEQRQTP